MSKNNFNLEIRSVASLKPGMKIPEKTYSFDTSHIFMFSAITWNRHKIHYDLNEAKKEGHTNILVQRGLVGNIFSQFINSSFVDVYIMKLNWRMFSSANPNDPLKCFGEITNYQENDSSNIITLSLTLLNQNGDKISESEANIRKLENWDITTPLTSS